MIGDALRQVPGLLVREAEPLAPRTTLRIGGPAKYFCEVFRIDALSEMLRLARLEGVRVLALGKGSNILVPDEGFPGIVFSLVGDFLKISIDGEVVQAGAGASLMSLAIQTRNAGLSGLENLSGIPSTVGGAIRINAGAYGSELFDLLESIGLVRSDGSIEDLGAATIPHGYRWSALMESDSYVTGGVLRLVQKPKEEIEGRFAEVTAKRKNALPKEPNAGSIFKNPPGHFAGKLLQECGLKGERAGGAMVSDRHANVIVNAGSARAADVRELMGRMRAAVLERFGIGLVPEIEVIE
jgi:UDP-N-acetylmuramate dehydrogenase